MRYITSKQFDKSFSKLPKKIKEKAIKRFELFVMNPMNETLNNYRLSGQWKMCRSINITGDIRAIYITEDIDIARFIDIGSHPKLYG